MRYFDVFKGVRLLKGVFGMRALIVPVPVGRGAGGANVDTGPRISLLYFGVFVVGATNTSVFDRGENPTSYYCDEQRYGADGHTTQKIRAIT